MPEGRVGLIETRGRRMIENLAVSIVEFYEFEK